MRSPNLSTTRHFSQPHFGSVLRLHLINGEHDLRAVGSPHPGILGGRQHPAQWTSSAGYQRALYQRNLYLEQELRVQCIFCRSHLYLFTHLTTAQILRCRSAKTGNRSAEDLLTSPRRAGRWRVRLAVLYRDGVEGGALSHVAFSGCFGRELEVLGAALSAHSWPTSMTDRRN